MGHKKSENHAVSTAPQPDFMAYKFDSKINIMKGKKSDYFYVALPRDMSDHILHFTTHIQRGFKSLKVKARIEETSWDSSIFPSTSKNTFLLFLNKKIRDAETLNQGDTVTVHLKIYMD